MCDNGIVGTWGGIPVEVINIPNSNQILVVRIDIEKYDWDVAMEIFETIQNAFPPDTKMIGLPVDVVLKQLDAEELDAVIEQLEIMKEQLK